MINENEKVISKIQKLFARKQSNFTAEAENALLKAQKLMIKHGLTMKDIEVDLEPQQEVYEKSVYHSQTPLWHGQVAGILARNFRCKHIWFSRYRNGRKIRVMTFIGYTDDAQTAGEAYTYAIALVHYNIRCIKKRYPRVTTGYINRYIDGFIDGLHIKFKEQVDKEGWELILVTPVPVESHYQSYNPITIKAKGCQRESSNNQNAYSKGYEDGKSFEHDQRRLNS